MANLAIPGRWLRHISDGTIYPYSPVMANNSAVEEVSGEIAFPEKNIPKKQKGRKSKLNLGTDVAVVAEVKPRKRKTNAALARDAGKGI